ncbi:MAG: glutamine synthetase family protein [Ilumatobacteraceae bacterium]
MTAREGLLAAVVEQIAQHGIHTVEVAVVDTYGHLRGKRVPADRFVSSVALDGVNIADAIYVFDVQCEIVDSPCINMRTGYLDMHLTPDLSTFRLLTHRPGYAIVMSDSFDEHGQPHTLDPRGVLARQVARCTKLGIEPIVATELECYICTPDWQPIQQHVQYSSLTDALELETVVAAMRVALLGAGIPLESSNAEYGPGQLEINFGPADPHTTADNTVLFSSIVKQVAVQHGCRATFMPKPLTGQSGSGMHIHSSLNVGGVNQFGATADGLPNETMSHWTAGLLEHARAMSLIGIPLPNGFRRVRPFTFAPTHVHWGGDNRTVLARLTMTSGSANRVEFRSAGADANPYLAIAAVLAAGCDGLERQLVLPPMAVGDTYSEPGDCVELPTTMSVALDAFRSSALAASLGAEFSQNFVVLAEYELALTAEAMAGDPDVVTDWERARYLEHT